MRYEPQTHYSSHKHPSFLLKDKNIKLSVLNNNKILVENGKQKLENTFLTCKTLLYAQMLTKASKLIL